MTVDNETVIFVSGVLQGKYTIMRNGMPELTEKKLAIRRKTNRAIFQKT